MNPTPKLEDRLDVEFAPAWHPDAGDKLTGEYGTYPIITLRRDDGEELAVHAYHSVLAAQLAEVRPVLGSRIAVQYTGRIEKRDGTGSYHGYKAVGDSAEPLFSWEKYGGPDVEPVATSDGPSDLVSPDDTSVIPF